jgi:hypothetical protein
MTTLEDRLLRVREELDRAATSYVGVAPKAAYVKTGPRLAGRPRVVVFVGAIAAVCLVALLLIHRDDAKTSILNDPPNGDAIEATVGGDSWLWPSADSGIVATSADQVAREFAARVLRLPDVVVVVVVNETDGGPYPTNVRIETPTLHLTLLVAPQGSPDHWVVHQLQNSHMSQTADKLIVPVPEGASTAEVFARYTNRVRASVLNIGPGAGAITVQLDDVVRAAIAVFRNRNRDVIDVQGGDFSVPTPDISRPTTR